MLVNSWRLVSQPLDSDGDGGRGERNKEGKMVKGFVWAKVRGGKGGYCWSGYCTFSMERQAGAEFSCASLFPIFPGGFMVCATLLGKGSIKALTHISDFSLLLVQRPLSPVISSPTFVLSD